MSNQRPNDFLWAHDANANLNEPFDDLKKQGWNYGDTPTASHFNWLFHEISKWQIYLEEQSKMTANALAELSKKVEGTKVDLKITQRSLMLVFNLLNAVRARVLEHHPHPHLPGLIINLPQNLPTFNHEPSLVPTLTTTDEENLAPIPDDSAGEGIVRKVLEQPF